MVNPVNRIVMKKTIQLISLCLMGILSLGLCSCEQRSEEEVGRALSIKVFAPTRVTPGETVTVSGTGLDKVKSVTLAGNKVTDFKVVNANMLYAQVPASATVAKGVVSVDTGDDQAEAKAELEIVLPTVTSCNPNDIVDGGTSITIFGTSLEAVSEAVFPGDLVVPSVDFLRKSDHQIVIPVPEKVTTGVGRVTLLTAGGSTLNSPEVKFVKKRTGHYEDIELTIYDKPYEVTYSKPLYIMKEWTDKWQVGMVISVYVRQKGEDKTEIKLLAGDGSDYKLPDKPFNNGQWYTSWTGEQVISFVLTQKLWDECWDDSKLYKGRAFRFSGKNYYIDKITVSATVWVWDDEE